ncbi:MAG: ABC transporter substrate-binding protein [Chloroflexi bacterium]|nr:ABC transporter substrate-binding protein [Chloroflexota bacterium]
MSSRSRSAGVVRALSLSLSLSIALGACSAGVPAGPSATPAAPSATPAATTAATVATTPSATPAATASPSLEPSPGAAFPVTIGDDEGTAVEIAAAPSRIVSLSPASTETLFELGAGARVVATDSASDYPETAAGLPDVADFTKVDVEAVVALDPDLVIAGGLGFTPADDVTRLRGLGVPVVVIYAPTVEAVYHDIELVGAAIGEVERASDLTDGMRAEIDTIHQSVSGQDERPRVFYEVGYTDATGEIYAPADGSFLAEMVALAGADPITTGDPNDYQIPLETLIERDPQIIILGVNPFYEPTPEAVTKRTGWKVMTAVKNGDIRPVRDIEITRPGPRLPIGLRNLAQGIWPDLDLPGAP